MNKSLIIRFDTENVIFKLSEIVGVGRGGPLLAKARLEKVREQSLRGDSNDYSWRHFPSRGVE